MFLLPSKAYDISQVHSNFLNQWNALRQLDFEVALYDHQQFITYGQLISDIDFTKSKRLILQTFPLTYEQYEKLYDTLKRNNLDLINSPQQFSNCHYYPNIYHTIKDFAPNSIWFTDINENVVELSRNHINSDIFISDWVRSLDSEINVLRSDLTTQEFFESVVKIKNYFKPVGGLVFKEFLHLKRHGNKTNQYKITILNGNIISENSNLDTEFAPKVDTQFLLPLINKIDSNFYSLNVAELETGGWVILKTEDAQFSQINSDLFIYYYNFTHLFETTNESLSQKS